MGINWVSVPDECLPSFLINIKAPLNRHASYGNVTAHDSKASSDDLQAPHPII